MFQNIHNMLRILKSFLKIFNLIVTICLIVTPSSAGPPSPRIINGTEATAEHAKFQVSIRLKRYDNTFGNGHICGGALVGPNKVLTAAHCLYDADKKRYRKAREFVVVMGTLNRYQRVNGTIVSHVKSIAYMNTFSMDTMRDDIGLMFLKTGLPENKTHLTIAPIALANTSTPAGVSCQVSGWGKTERGSLSPTLRVANVSTISKSVCAISYSSGLYDGMICAGYILGGTDSCQGDSGGPLVFNNTLIGIVSWGSGCAQPGYPGVYADVRYYNKWITERNLAIIKMPVYSILVLTTFISYIVNSFR
ncbi:trypsin alpha-3 [Lucilia sericata]|uniref:trypsin alpha-3 n=1 Tax=Lucilia sericata TaxID=13632 RepID=UPI0018A845F5|nr:trypsin alpha-3 [Lucilia sericata]